MTIQRLITMGAIIGSAMLSGCLSTASSFVTSASPVEQGKYTELSPEVSGSCTQVQWLFFTFGKSGSPQRHALKDALVQIPDADTLTAMAVDVEQFAFLSTTLMPLPILPVFTKTRVTGTPVKTNAQ